MSRKTLSLYYFFSFTALLLLLLSSCSGGRRHYVIAVSSCSNDMWREKLNDELTTSTYLYDNVELRIQSANDDDRRQINQINGFVDDGVDLLIVSPNQLKTISPAINRAYSKHIPVVLFDRKTDTDKYTSYIGADNVKVGRDMGQQVAKIMQGRGHLVIIKGLRGSSAAIERDSGFMSVINTYKDIHVVGSCYADWQYEKALTGMNGILSRTTDIDCVFAQNDRMALGARRAVEQKGITRHIDYVGVDALPARGGGLECVNNGTLTASYIYPTRGDLVMALAMDILEGRPFKRENSLDGALVTKDNAHVLLLQNEELSRQRERLYTLHDKVDMYLAQYSHQRVYAMLSALIIILMLISFAVIYRTIIIRRRLAEEAAESKLTFFTNVSHEFRTPLTLIADPVDRLIADPRSGEEQNKLLRLVRKNVDVMLKLVNEILDLRKVQNGRMALKPSLFNLTDALTQWTDGFMAAAARKNINITTDVAADFESSSKREQLKLVSKLPSAAELHASKSAETDIYINADREKVERIVFNLLSNALKFTPEGGRINVSAHINGGNVTLSVADNGQGMTADDARHAFERFYQAGKTTGGTGIGLALVKAFTEMHHGTASVSSTPGQGATFTVTLPAGVAADLKSAETDSNAKATIHRSSGNAVSADFKSAATDFKYDETDATVDFNSDATDVNLQRDRISDPDLLAEQKPLVLVVDDSPTMRHYIASILAEKYDVLQADNGDSGLQQALKSVPDIIISDVMMPGIDGMEMCRRLKHETATSHIPVILLTAMALEDQRAEGYDCGADAYITKPFSSKVVMARVNNLLETRRQLKSLYSNDEADIYPAGANTSCGGFEISCGGFEIRRNSDTDSRFIADFNRIVTTRMADSSLSVEDIAAELNLSRVQMYRKVKALTGSTPVELIRLIRLKRADKMLRQGGRTVSEVAYDVGFSSPSYFAKCFKEQFGRLPSE